MKNKYKNIYTKPTRLCYNKAAARTKSRAIAAVVGLVSIVSGVQASNFVANQVSADVRTGFQVNVVESLSVSVTTPSEWAHGSMNTFLRNAVNLEVSSNTGNGFTASMYAKGDTTNLTNTTSGNFETLPTLGSSSTRTNFPSNYWGYSLGRYTLDGVAQSAYTLNGNSYGETAEGNLNSNYYPLVNTSNTPITIMNGTNKARGTQDIYFGAKANAAQASGTYEGTVVINVVTGTIDPSTNPITPTNPATDHNTNPANNPAYAYDAANNRTVYTYSSTNSEDATETTSTTVTSGDTTDSYKRPQGVIENTVSHVSNNTALATGLAVTAAVAASSGYTFFIVANRREREDEEES